MFQWEQEWSSLLTPSLLFPQVEGQGNRDSQKLLFVFWKLFLNFKQKVTCVMMALARALPSAGKVGGCMMRTVVSQTSDQPDLENLWFGFRLEQELRLALSIVPLWK